MTFLACSYEPPSIGLVLNDTLEGGLLAKPLRFQERGQISKRRGMEGVSFWYPVAPPGYVAMGCIASKSSVPEPDGANHVCCVRNELVTRVNFTAHSIWDSSTLRHGNEELSIWPVENEVIVGHLIICRFCYHHHQDYNLCIPLADLFYYYVGFMEILDLISYA